MADVHTQNNPQQASTQDPPRREEREGTRAIEPQRRTDLGRPGWGASPFSFMRRFMSEMDRLLEDFGVGSSTLASFPTRIGEMLPRGAWAPQVDVFERGGQLIVHADLPGLRQEDVRVNVEEGALTISGERRHTHEHEKGGVYQCERSYGSFQRVVALPQGLDPESVRATFDNGVLEITMPMPKEQRPRGRSIPIGGKDGGVKH